MGKVVQENQGKRDMGRVIYGPNVSWRVRWEQLGFRTIGSILTKEIC